MPKSTPAQWSAARALWEADPSRTLKDVARSLNVALPTVSERAARDGWAKLSKQAAERDMAHQVTDVLGQISGRDELLDKVGAALDLSISTRVKVINRHRIELGRWRSLFPLEAMAGDPVAAKRAKAAAEALSIVQRSECIAYGLVSFTGTDTGAPLVEADVEDAQVKSPLDAAMEHFLRTGELPSQPPLTVEAPNDQINQ